MAIEVLRFFSGPFAKTSVLRVWQYKFRNLRHSNCVSLLTVLCRFREHWRDCIVVFIYWKTKWLLMNLPINKFLNCSMSFHLWAPYLGELKTSCFNRLRIWKWKAEKNQKTKQKQAENKKVVNLPDEVSINLILTQLCNINQFGCQYPKAFLQHNFIALRVAKV